MRLRVESMIVEPNIERDDELVCHVTLDGEHIGVMIDEGNRGAFFMPDSGSRTAQAFQQAVREVCKAGEHSVSTYVYGAVRPMGVSAPEFFYSPFVIAHLGAREAQKAGDDRDLTTIMLERGDYEGLPEVVEAVVQRTDALLAEQETGQ